MPNPHSFGALEYGPRLARNIRIGSAVAATIFGIMYISHSETPIKLPKGTVEVAPDQSGERKFLPPAGTAEDVNCGASDKYLWMPPVRTYEKSIDIVEQGGQEVEYVVCGSPSAQIPQETKVVFFNPES